MCLNTSIALLCCPGHLGSASQCAQCSQPSQFSGHHRTGSEKCRQQLQAVDICAAYTTVPSFIVAAISQGYGGGTEGKADAKNAHAQVLSMVPLSIPIYVSLIECRTV